MYATQIPKYDNSEELLFNALREYRNKGAVSYDTFVLLDEMARNMGVAI